MDELIKQIKAVEHEMLMLRLGNDVDVYDLKRVMEMLVDAMLIIAKTITEMKGGNNEHGESFGV